THPLLLIPVGCGYFLLYYVLFRIAIVRFNLPTPGRELTEVVTAGEPATAPGISRGPALISALGGPDNIVSLDACTTRLRLVITRQDAVNVAELTRLGMRGIVRPSADTLQVVVGPEADQLAGEMKAALRSRGSVVSARPPEHDAQAALPGAPAAALLDTAALLRALGGTANVREVHTAASRLRLNIADACAVDQPALIAMGVRDVVLPRPDCLHLIIGPAAGATGDALRTLLPLTPELSPHASR
ncbi:MAG: PTS transporter subunit EIIB, partial [Sinobacteraceae bacterium]|nr:PTS transporter subunit EIIB [Nevskiaceae bacterium]